MHTKILNSLHLKPYYQFCHLTYALLCQKGMSNLFFNLLKVEGKRNKTRTRQKQPLQMLHHGFFLHHRTMNGYLIIIIS